MNEPQSSGLFSIFVISIFSLGLIPYTIYALCCSDDGSSVELHGQKGGKKKSKLQGLVRKYATKGNLVLLLLWGLWFLMLLWVQASVKDMKPFDPFEILGVDRSATEREVKKAYKTLALKYHPDKNPDPAAAKYFAEFITKAYKALTDEASRQNYEKYGHPDGPQAMNVGVALPNFMFSKDKKAGALMLLALVGCGILLPLVGISWYMLSSNKFAGPNNVMQETLAIFLHSKFSVKESQSLVRVPETLVCAVEFITLPTPAEHMAPLDELRKAVLRYHPDLKDKAAFWKRKASVLKVHMLLLAFLERDESDIPAILKPDLNFVLTKAPVLLQEMLNIAGLPRPPHGHGWLTPAVAVVEMKQCLAQAMSLSDRRPQGKQADASTLLLQLPHFDNEVVKKLKRRKIGSIKELQEVPEVERTEVLTSVGLSAAQAEEVSTFLLALPTVHARVTFEMEGEDEIMERDIAKCKVRLIVTRPSHSLPTFEPPPKGKAIRAFTPHFPLPHDENWHVMLADPSSNSLIGHVKVGLAEAEAVGAQRGAELVEEWSALASAAEAAAGGKKGDASRAAVVPRAADTASKFIRTYKPRSSGKLDAEANNVPAEEAGQLVEIPFMAPFKAGKYDWQVIVMCDAYVGCDRTLPARLRVAPLTRVAQETREARKRHQRGESDDESESGAPAKGKRGSAFEQQDDDEVPELVEPGARGSDEDEDEEDEEEDADYDYDSEETGELETDSEDEAADAETDGKQKPQSKLLQQGSSATSTAQ